MATLLSPGTEGNPLLSGSGKAGVKELMVTASVKGSHTGRRGPAALLCKVPGHGQGRAGDRLHAQLLVTERFVG